MSRFMTRFTKQSRIDCASAVDQLRLILVDDERERFLNQHERAAIADVRAILNTKIVIDIVERGERIG